MSELTKEAKREAVFQFLATPQKFRGKHYQVLCKDLGITRGTFHKWKTMYQENKGSNKIIQLRQEVAQQTKAVIIEKKKPGDEESQWAEYMETLRRDATTPGAPANVRELYAKLKGKLLDKKEVTVDFTGSDIARIALGIERDTGVSSQRVSKVSEKLQILPPDICVSDQQEHGQES